MELSDDAVVHIVNNPQEPEEPDTDDITPKESHSDGLNGIDNAIACTGQRESMPLDLLTLQRSRYIMATKRGK
ncbi:hypothetical protein J6590_104095, partial [Homalodisca vitripennis]